MNLRQENTQNVCLLDGLFDGAVGGEGLQLLLYARQGVGKLLVADDGDGLLDPVQQVRGQPLVAVHDLLRLYAVLKDLEPVCCYSYFCPSVRPSVRPSVCLSVRLSDVCLSTYLSFKQSVYLSVHLLFIL